MIATEIFDLFESWKMRWIDWLNLELFWELGKVTASRLRLQPAAAVLAKAEAAPSLGDWLQQHLRTASK